MDINNVKWDSKGLIPAVIQDDSSMNVLMVVEEYETCQLIFEMLEAEN
jgi:phosphoribosyl-AMP cyclohydrolase